MTADAQHRLAGANSTSTRTLLRVVILCLIAAAAIASRLFSVIRKCCSRGYARSDFLLLQFSFMSLC